MAQKKPENKYYSFIVVNKTKRNGFIPIFLFIFLLMTFIITTNNLQDYSWLRIVFVLILLGIPIILFPTIEEWAYRPWQAKAQKYERHYID